MEKNSKESSTPTILVLAFHTPPQVRPRAIMIGKIVNQMIRQKIEPVILTYDTCGIWNINLTVHTISPFVLEKNKLSEIPIVKTLRANWMEFLYYMKIFKKTEGIIKKHNIDAVFSFSNPQSSNILGALIRKRLQIPFVSYFSDPWIDNPYNTFTLLQNIKIRFLESFVIKWSDRVGFTNKEALELVMKKYPSKWKLKGVVIPHCFDSNDYPQKIEKVERKFVISHIGAFYKKRTPETLFIVIRKILDAKTIDSSMLSIKLVGGALDYADYSLDNLTQLIKKYGLQNIVEILPAVSYKESLVSMSTSDLLVVIDADMDTSPFLPSKVVDYAGSTVPIVGITPKKSPTEKFLHALGYSAFEHKEVEKLGSYLSQAINKKSVIEPNVDFLKNYKSDTVVAELLHQIKIAINQ